MAVATKKKIVKTVNRTGKKINKAALVVKEKKAPIVSTKEDIAKLNEAKLAQHKAPVESKVEEVKTSKKDERKLEDKKYNLTIGLKEMLDAGCHLGHKVSKTQPRARTFIYSAKDGIEIIDLTKTMAGLQAACDLIYNAKRNGKQVLMVGTKRVAREVTRRVALDAGVPYVTDRWLGGTISNWEQIRKTIKRYRDLKDGLETNKFADLTKKEQGELHKELARLERNVGGIGNLDKLFDVVFVVDSGFEKTAVREATGRKLKTVAMVDTDSNPELVDTAIPTNDDNVRAVTLIVEEIGRAIKAAGVK
jgi:small subunit ribosomal protein S2